MKDLTTQMMVAFGWWCQVDCDNLYIPKSESQALNGLNQWTYVRVSCEGNLKIVQISATWRPVKNAKLRIRNSVMYTTYL